MGTGYEIGKAVEFLIHEGHDEERVWKMTLRRIQGWIAFAVRRKVAERAELLSVVAMAYRAEGKKLEKIMKDLAQEAR